MKSRESKSRIQEVKNRTLVTTKEFESYLDSLGIEHSLIGKWGSNFEAIVKNPVNSEGFTRIKKLNDKQSKAILSFSDLYNDKITKGFFKS